MAGNKSGVNEDACGNFVTEQMGHLSFSDNFHDFLASETSLLAAINLEKNSDFSRVGFVAYFRPK